MSSQGGSPAGCPQRGAFLIKKLSRLTFKFILDLIPSNRCNNLLLYILEYDKKKKEKDIITSFSNFEKTIPNFIVSFQEFGIKGNNPHRNIIALFDNKDKYYYPIQNSKKNYYESHKINAQNN